MDYCEVVRRHNTSRLSIQMEIAQCRAVRSRDTFRNVAADVIRQLVAKGRTDHRLTDIEATQALQIALTVGRTRDDGPSDGRRRDDVHEAT